MEQIGTIKQRDIEAKRVVEGVIDGEPILKLSKNLGMSRNKIYRLVFGATGQDILSTAYYESLDTVTYHLPNLVLKAIHILEAAMSNPNSVEPKSLLAAKMTLDQFHRLERLIEKNST